MRFICKGLGTMIVLVVIALLGGIVIGSALAPRARAQGSLTNITFTPVALHGRQTGVSGTDIASRMVAYCDSLGDLLYFTTGAVSSIAVVPGGCR